MGSAVAPVLWSDVDVPIDALAVPRTQRQLGAFYTPSQAASFMAQWAIRRDGERVIEPSMGDGQFLRAIAVHAERSDYHDIEAWGVELDQETYRTTIGGGVVEPERAILGDFLQVDPFPVDIAIGNPPYFRLRHLPAMEAERGRLIGSAGMGTQMDPAGSIWLPFVIHATDFLRDGGRLAFVLPFDLTYVRYAKPLWRFLGREFGSLRVIRVHERLFPELLQDVVLLLADDRGSTTSSVQYDCFERRSDLLGGSAIVNARLDLARVVSDERPFMEALLPRALRSLLDGKVREVTIPMRDQVTWNIGYVSGDKTFFHPSADTITECDLPSSSLVPAISSGRRATKHGLMTAGLPGSASQQLFLPPADASRLTGGDRTYIEHGRSTAVHRRYKCRIREPWYVTPGVRTPDIVMPVFADRPVLLVNDGLFAVSNSMLAGYLRTGSAEQVAAAWYTSLTLLQVELAVHSLGGGVLVMVPREAGSIRIPGAASTGSLSAIDADLRSGAFEGAYERGDTSTLHEICGLSSDDIESVREGIGILRRWRRSGGTATTGTSA